MKKYGDIQTCLIENLKNQDTVFVFSTDVVKNSWIDWLVMNPEISGTNTVPLERFIAWDNFKSEYVSASQEGKSVIPSLLKKLFVRTLIENNKKQPFFKRVINPQFAAGAASFADWICKILPGLNLWYQKFNAFIESGSPEAELQKNDEENQDYLELYNRYSEFLEKNAMFEPSWVIPEFDNQKLKIFVFYPEIYDDYADYADILKKAPQIQVISLPEEKADGSDRPDCYRYADARQELRRTILQMRKLVHPEESGENAGEAQTTTVQWNQIALSVPDLETYRPYLERELTKYAVPYVIRAGFPLTLNCAGQIFSQFNECSKSDFSYDSVRSLLQNENIPWKKQIKNGNISFNLAVVKENLIREGNRLRCLCSYTDESGRNIDIWHQALAAVPEDDIERRFYDSLKKDVQSICGAKSFREIHEFWNIFKGKYIEESDYSAAANNILGRCVTHLNEMIQIEEEYGEKNELCVGNHFDVFLTELESKTYTPQNKKIGLNVFPYKLSAQAKFDWQFVINGSQKNLEIPFKRLSFLSTEKRAALGLLDEDKKYNPSHSFIRLYDLNCKKDLVHFSYSEESFDGFAIAHTFLNLVGNKKNPETGEEIFPLSELDEKDFYLNEKKLFMSGKASSDSPFTITEQQKNQFEIWTKLSSGSEERYSVSEDLKSKIQEYLVTKRQQNGRKNFVLTQTDMKAFFPCPRKWILSKILNLKEDSLDTDLIKVFEMGTINHKILEEFMKIYCKSGKPLPVTNQDNLFDDENEIQSLVLELAEKTVNSFKNDFSQSPLVITMLNSQLEAITTAIMNFLHNFCVKGLNAKKTEGFGGYIVSGVEQEGSVEGKDYDIYGKLDLVLKASAASAEDADKIGWTIADYKNSAIPSAGELKLQEDLTLENFQMPAYILVKTKTHPEEKNFTDCVKKIDFAGFFSISKGAKEFMHAAVDSHKPNATGEDYVNVMNSFKEYLEEFNSKAQNLDFMPVTRASDKKISVDTWKHCLKCNFNSVCRYNYTVGRKNIKTSVQAAQAEIASSDAQAAESTASADESYTAAAKASSLAAKSAPAAQTHHATAASQTPAAESPASASQKSAESD